MRKLVLVLAVFISAHLPLKALQDCCRCPTWPKAFNFTLGTGFRQDSLNWRVKIPDVSGSPFIRSALHWNNVRMAQVYGDASYTSCRNYTIKVSGDYAQVYHGRNKDLDYFITGSGCGQDKVLFSETKANAGKGHAFDASGAVGYRWTSSGGRAIITPLIGWSHHQQYFTMYDGNQIVDLINDQIGPFRGLDSHYKTRWYGPWIGADFDVRVECCTNLFGSFEYHYNKYRGAGHWNLRDDFAGDFRHRAWGHGIIARLGTSWDICPNWTLGIMGNYVRYRTGTGADITPVLTEGGVVVHVRNKLSIVKWHSFSIMGIVVWRF